MKPTVPVETGRASRSAQESRGEATPRGAAPESARDTAAALLARLEQLIDSELGALRAGVEPLLDEVRRGLDALNPGSGGTRLPPKEQQAQRASLGHAMDQLEDVLEALQLAARGGSRTPDPSRKGA